MSRDWLSRLFLVVIVLGLAVIFSEQYSAHTDNFDGLRVWYFDVGQGDSELIDTPSNQQILIDGGPDESVVSQVSRALGTADRYIDLIIVSHYHADHLTGLNAVLAHYQVGEIWTSGAVYDSATYRKFVELAASKNIKVTNVVSGTYRNFGEVRGDVLTPLTSFAGTTVEDAHKATVVTEFEYGQQKLLFAGDMESDLEKSLISRGLLDKVTILKVGHHGSSTSSSPDFINVVQPNFAVIEVGRDNKYGHPVDSTLQKLKAIGAKIFRTDQDGTIKFLLDGQSANYTLDTL